MRRLANWQLFALAVVVWGTTWHAIVHQIAHGTPELGVTWRFVLAGAAVLLCARLFASEAPVRGWRAHGVLALQGAFMYSLAYLAVYHAEQHVPSGLVAVGYSASPLLAGLGAWLLWRTAVSKRFVAGGVLGMVGVALIFWPELDTGGQRPGAVAGLAWTVAAVLLSAVGALVAVKNGPRGLPFWGSMGVSMLYGGGLSALVLLAGGQSLAPPLVPTWWLSLAYLSAAGTVVAFGAFLTLQQRIGPGRAATVGVMTPVVALVVSALFERYQPTWQTAAGVGLAILGNRWMLARPPSTTPSTPSPVTAAATASAAKE